MAKFASIWGDLEVRDETITPAAGSAQGKVESKEPPKKEEFHKEEDEDEEEVITTDPPEDTEEEEEEEEEEYVYSEGDVEKAYGMLEEEGVLDLNDDEEFEATTAGLADAVAATVRNKLAREIASIPPVVQEFYAHVMEGHDAKTFKPSGKEVDWKEFDISTEESQKKALRVFYKNQGMSEDAIEEEIEDAENSDKLEKKATIAIEALGAQQEEKEKARVKAQAIATAEAEKARKEEILELQKTIDSAKTIAGFELDDVKRKGFKDYLFKVNPRTGKSQMQENMGSEERRMTIAFLDFVNYTKADLEKEVASKLTKDRKKKLSRYTDKNVGNSNSSASVKTKINKNKGQIVFPSIFGTQTIEIED